MYTSMRCLFQWLLRAIFLKQLNVCYVFCNISFFPRPSCLWLLCNIRELDECGTWIKVHKEERKQKYKKIYVAKYDKQRRHQSLPSLSSNAMALRAGCDDKWSVSRQAQGNCIKCWTQSHSRYMIYGTH